MKSFESHVAIFLTKVGQKGTTVVRTISFRFEYWFYADHYAGFVSGSHL